MKNGLVYGIFIFSICFFQSCGPTSSNQSLQDPESAPTQQSHGSSRSPDSNPSATPSASPSPFVPHMRQWSVSYVAQCPRDMPLERCSGGYGFQMRSDGSYEVGPAPEGLKLNGVVSPDDLDKVAEAVQDELRAPQNTSDCMSRDSAQLSLRVEGDERSHCRLKILDTVKDILSHYYPSSFPNSCLDANSELESDYARATHCESDSDCSYLDEEYFPMLNDDAGRAVLLDDCTYIEPLVVANTFKSVELQRELILKRQAVRQVCGANLKRGYCGGTRYFDSKSGFPRCEHETCQVGAPHIYLKEMEAL